MQAQTLASSIGKMGTINGPPQFTGQRCWSEPFGTEAGTVCFHGHLLSSRTACCSLVPWNQLREWDFSTVAVVPGELVPMGTLAGKLAGGPMTLRGVCGAAIHRASSAFCTARSTSHVVTFHLCAALYGRDNQGPARFLSLPKVTQLQVKPLTCCT